LVPVVTWRGIVHGVDLQQDQWTLVFGIVYSNSTKKGITVMTTSIYLHKFPPRPTLQLAVDRWCFYQQYQRASLFTQTLTAAVTQTSRCRCYNAAAVN